MKYDISNNAVNLEERECTYVTMDLQYPFSLSVCLSIFRCICLNSCCAPDEEKKD